MFIDVNRGNYHTCDGIARRSFLRAGALAFGGLTLADFFRQQAAAGEDSKKKELSVILIWQGGGPSHLDMWDLKPQAPAEFRGTFNPIKTSLDGYQVCEHMPKIAKVCDKLSIVRTVTHPDPGHDSAAVMLMTGYKPTGNASIQEVPSCGSIVCKELGACKPGFPPYVAVPTAAGFTKAAYLGAQHNPFEVMGDPNSIGYKVQNLNITDGINLERLENRRALMKQFDRLRSDVDASGIMDSMDKFTEKTFELVTSPQAQQAFDLQKEDAKTRDMYGRTTLGQSLLMARRLTEAGVRFVTINDTKWDSHVNNFEFLKTSGLPPFDQAFSALIQDLEQRGRLDSTLVLVWGEFGRTPKITVSNAGREHWPNCFTAVMAGGGMKRGMVLGESDSRAEFPKERPVSPQDVLATMYEQLGIKRDKIFHNEANRPVEILNYGTPIKEIIA